LKEGKRLTIHGKGKTRRNFIWAEDVATATELILYKGEINGIYNIGTTQEYSVMDVAKIIVEKMTEEAVHNYIEFVEDRPFNDSRYSVDATLLKSLGWKEKHTDFVANIEKLIQIASENTSK
jgi:dTDP-D-glucose 4,6-dehydratase